MQAKGKLYGLMVLVAATALCASCGGTPITAETVNPVEQTIETTSTGLFGTIGNNEAPTEAVTDPDQATSSTNGTIPSSVRSTAAQSNTSSTTSTIINGSSSATAVTTTTKATTNRALSQAWIDSQALLLKQGSGDFADRNIYIDYLSTNPNDVSTPMGALCWSLHELVRSQEMDFTRFTFDNYMIPFLMENYGITNEQIGPPGTEATGKLFDLILGDIGPVSSTDDSPGQIASPGEPGAVGSVGSIDDTEDAMTEANSIEYFKNMHEFAGDGTAWPVAVGTIASPEMTDAFEAGEGLPATVQVYADALIAFAKEHVGKPLDHSAESDALSFALAGFPGIDAFVEEAKYNQDCKRAPIAS